MWKLASCLIAATLRHSLCFWATALGYVTLGGVENYVLLVPDGRPGPKLLLQQVPEEKSVRTECTSTSRWLISGVSPVVSNGS